MTRPFPSLPKPHDALVAAPANLSLRHVFVRDLLLEARIGVYAHEREAAQPVRLNLDLWVAEASAPLGDQLDNVLCYQAIVDEVTAIIAGGHINLVETLAERIAASLLRDPRARSVRVQVEKLQAVANAASVGIAIERHNGL